MFYVQYIVLVYFIEFSTTINYIEGWNYINLHCRDNENTPVDWWYIYKPPSMTVPYLERGHNFTYITPSTAGRWQYSSVYLTSMNSMLHSTLSPLFRQTYKNHIAVVSYDQRSTMDDEEGTSAFGIMMADELGGAWIGHSVPELLDMTKDRISFPVNESDNGHIIVCLSLDLLTLNKLGVELKKINPKFTTIRIPTSMKEHLPMWSYINHPDRTLLRSYTKGKTMDFNTRQNTLFGFMMLRQPGDNSCFYEIFARKNHIVIDVYGHKHSDTPICQREYSVRNIDAISIKAPGHVSYIPNARDRAGFAVSTAAHWQRSGTGPKQYWACVNNYDNTNEALIICVNDYNVWLTFDNFKIKEPEC